MKKQLTGVELIAKERQEQIEKHGYTTYEDHQRYTDDEYEESGILHAVIGILKLDTCEFPNDWDKERIRKILCKPYVERLSIAGALIAAEIDRLNALNNG